MKWTKNPFAMGYEPKIDSLPELGPDLVSWYQPLIGMLRWIVDLGRINIITEVSVMAP